MTYLRVKLVESCMDAGGKGWNMIPSVYYFKITDVVRSTKEELFLRDSADRRIYITNESDMRYKQERRADNGRHLQIHRR